MEGELPGCPTLMLLALCEYHVTGVGKLRILPAEGDCLHAPQEERLPQASQGVQAMGGLRIVTLPPLPVCFPCA